MGEERIRQIFGGYAITSASIASKERIAFGVKEIYDFEKPQERFGKRVPDDSELEARVVLYNPVVWKAKDSFVAERWRSGILRMNPVFTGFNSVGHIVVCFLDGHMQGYFNDFPQDADWYAREEVYNHKFDFPHRAMHAARNIGGDVYFAGTPRKLFKRTGPDQWRDLTAEADQPRMYADINAIDKKQGNLRGLPLGFHAFDGFDGQDIYAGGRFGDLWHFDGQTWRRMDLPTNQNIQTITCGGDGRVHIGCENGALFAGRYDKKTGEQWQPIDHEAGISGLTSSTWFADRLWLGARTGLFVCHDGKVARYAFPDKRSSVGGDVQLSSCADAMLAYNAHSAVVFDGKVWSTILRTEIEVAIPSVEQIKTDLA